MSQASLSEALWISSPSVSGAGRFDAATIAKNATRGNRITAPEGIPWLEVKSWAKTAGGFG